MNEEIALRFAEIGDMDEIRALYKPYDFAGIAVDKERVMESIDKAIEKKGVIIATFKNIIIGGVWVEVSEGNISTDTICHAVLFCIKEEYRRFTVEFMRRLEALLSATPVTRLMFCVPENADADKYKRFYRTMGYRQTETTFGKVLKNA